MKLRIYNDDGEQIGYFKVSGTRLSAFFGGVITVLLWIWQG